MLEIAAAIPGANDKVAPEYAVVRSLVFVSEVTFGFSVAAFVIVNTVILLFSACGRVAVTTPVFKLITGLRSCS